MVSPPVVLFIRLLIGHTLATALSINKSLVVPLTHVLISLATLDLHNPQVSFVFYYSDATSLDTVRRTHTIIPREQDSSLGPEGGRTNKINKNEKK